MQNELLAQRLELLRLRQTQSDLAVALETLLESTQEFLQAEQGFQDARLICFNQGEDLNTKIG